jgi:uncharacterized protein (TIGR02246 family)
MPRFSIAICLLVVATAMGAQAPDQLYTATRLQLDVTKVLLAQERAWNNGDLDGYLSFYKDAPDTQAVLGSFARGRDAIRNAFRLNFPSREAMGTLEQTEIEVRPLGETFALATGRYHLSRSRKGGGDADGTFTEVFEKTASGWLIVLSETT